MLNVPFQFKMAKDRNRIMQKDGLNNVHIRAEQVLITPEELKN